jgi:hypothetical protein
MPRKLTPRDIWAVLVDIRFLIVVLAALAFIFTRVPLAFLGLLLVALIDAVYKIIKDLRSPAA